MENEKNIIFYFLNIWKNFLYTIEKKETLINVQKEIANNKKIICFFFKVKYMLSANNDIDRDC